MLRSSGKNKKQKENEQVGGEPSVIEQTIDKLQNETRQKQYSELSDEEKKDAKSVVEKIAQIIYTIRNDKSNKVDFNNPKAVMDHVKASGSKLQERDFNVLKKLNMSIGELSSIIYNLIRKKTKPEGNKQQEQGSQGNNQGNKNDNNLKQSEENAIKTKVEGFPKNKWNINAFLIVDSSMEDRNITIKAVDAIFKNICNRAGGTEAEPTASEDGEGDSETKDKNKGKKKRRIANLFFIDDDSEEKKTSKQLSMNDIVQSVGKNNSGSYELGNRVSLKSFKDINQPIDLVVRIADGDNGKQYDVQYLLYMGSLVGDKIPYVINRVNDKFYEGALFTYPKGTQDIIQKLRTVIARKQSTKNPDFSISKEHDSQVDAIQAQLRSNQFIKPESVTLLVDYKMNVTATAQQQAKVKLDFEISESLLQLSNDIRKNKYEKGLKAFIVNDDDIKTGKAEEKKQLWNDFSTIPNQISMLIVSDYVDYDILGNLMKMLEFTNHKLQHLIISKQAYDSEGLQALNLKSKFVTVTTFDKGGLWEMLDGDVDFNLIVDFKRKTQGIKLSQLIINEHYLKTHVSNTGFFVLDDNYNLQFHIRLDLTQTEFPEYVTQLGDVYNGIMGNLQQRQTALVKSDIASYNATLEGLGGLIASVLEPIKDRFINDFMLFKNYYALSQISTQQQNKNVIEQLKASLIEKKDSEFYNVITSLASSDNAQGIEKLSFLSKLPSNIDVLLINYNGAKKDFVSLVKDLLSANRINNLYVNKADVNDDIANVFSPSNIVTFVNVYELFQKMVMSGRKEVNIDLVINASTEGQLSTSQKVMATAVLTEADNAYIGISKNDDQLDVVVYNIADKVDVDKTSSKTISDLKTFGRLLNTKKIGNDLVEFNEVVETLTAKRDPDLSFFLDRTTAQPIKKDVFTDDLKALTTLLQERENEKLSSFITMNFDQFRTAIKTLPKDNTVMVMDFQDTFSTFESALKTARVMLKGVERNIVKAFHHQNANNIRDKLMEYLNLSDDTTIAYSSLKQLHEMTKNSGTDKVKLIIKGTSQITPVFVLFLRVLVGRGENPLVLMFDFDNQTVAIKPASEIASNASAQFTNDQLDEVYKAFNVIEAIKSKILSLNENGQKYFMGNKGGKTFDRDLYVKDLNELNGIINTFDMDLVTKGDFMKVINEYVDALMTIDLTEKLNTKNVVVSKIYDITKDYAQLKRYTEEEQDNIKSFVNKLYITFSSDKELAKPGLLKYRQIMNVMGEQDYKLEAKSVKKKGMQELSLDFYIRKGFIQEARDKYKRGVNEILSKPGSLVYEKINVLRKLFDSLYKVQYGVDDVSAGKDEGTRNKFNRFVVAPEGQGNYYAAIQADVIIETLKYNAQQNTTQLAKLVDDKTLDKTTIVSEIVRVLFTNIAKNPKLSKCPYYQLIRDTVEDNVHILVNDVSKVWSSNWRWIPFIDAKNKEETKKNLITHYFFDRHIIPVFIDREHLMLPYGQFAQVPCDSECITKLNLLSPSGTNSIKLLPDGVVAKSGTLFKTEVDTQQMALVSMLASYFVNDYGVVIDKDIQDVTKDKEMIASLKTVVKMVLDTAEKNLPQTESTLKNERAKLASIPKNSVEALRQERVIAPIEKDKKLYVRTVSIMKRVEKYFDLYERFINAKQAGDVPQALIEEVQKYNDRVNNLVSSGDDGTKITMTLAQFENLPRAPDAQPSPTSNNDASVFGFLPNQKDFEDWYNTTTNKFKANITTSDDVVDIKNDYIVNGYRIIKNELWEIVNGQVVDVTDNKMAGGVDFLLMDDVFNTLFVVLNELAQLAPALETDVNTLKDIAIKIKDALKNPAIASIYFINQTFQKEIIDNQFWMHLMLKMNNPNALAKLVEDNDVIIDRKVSELLREYEKVCEKIRNSTVFKESQGYINEIAAKKKQMSGGADVDDKDRKEDETLPTPNVSEVKSGEVDDEDESNTTNTNTSNDESTKQSDVANSNVVNDANSDVTGNANGTVNGNVDIDDIQLEEKEEPPLVLPSPVEQVEEKPPSKQESPKPKDAFKDEVDDFQGTELYRIIDFIKNPTNNKAKEYLKTLFTSDLGDVPVKKVNTITTSPSASFQFGGGFFWNRGKASQDNKATESDKKMLPEFKPEVAPKPFQPNLSEGDDIDFEQGVKILFGTDPELTNLLISYNKKQQELLENEPIVEKVSIRKQIANVANGNKAFREFFDVINEDEVDATVEAIKSIIRPNMTKMLTDAKYDVTRVSKQIKSQPPVKLYSDEVDVSAPIIDVPKEDEESEKVTPSVQEQKAPEKNVEFVSDEYKAQQAYVQGMMKSNEPEKPKMVLQSMADKISGIVSNVNALPSSPSTSPSNSAVSSSDSKLPNLTQTHLYIQEVLTDLDNFYKKMQRKQGRWAEEINAMLSQGEVSLTVQIQTKVNMLGSGKLLEIERRKISIQLLYLMKKFIRAIEDKSTVNYATFKDYFFQDKRRGIRAILDYLKQFSFMKDDLFIAKFNDNDKLKQKAQQLRETFVKIETTFTNYLKIFHNMNETFYNAMSEVLDDTVADMYTINMRDKERSQIILKKRDLLTEMQAMPKKIKSFYTLNYPVTEMFDAQFVIMYIIKAVRIVSFQFSMNMATNVFIQKYNSVVYDKKVNPPSLVSYMMIFLGFDLFFNVFLLVLLGLLGFLFKTENNTFPIDSYLYTKFAFDYVVSTIVIILNGILIGSVIKQKKYFRYKTEGERGIRAFEEMMKMSATVITLLPLFMIVSG